ncbi:hypothetical protein GQR58_027672 [Nymphon striatum]|nr:hypothetical protein GQR58_027672 [Nymphon striatum]
MIVRVLLSFVLLISHVLCENNIYYSAETYPNIKMPGSREKCSSTKSLENKLLLCDPDGVLQPDEANNIGSALEDFQSQTKCLCDICDSESGIKAYVAIANSIYKEYQIFKIAQTDVRLERHIFPFDSIRNLLDTLPAGWIGRRGSIDWAPRSCDFTPMDFSIWGMIKDKVFRGKPRTLVQLQTSITSEFEQINANKLYASSGEETQKYLTPTFTKNYNRNITKHSTFQPNKILMGAIKAYSKEIQRGQQKVNKESDPLDHKALIGGIVGAVLFILFVVLLFVFFKYANMGETKLKSIKKINDPEAPKPVYRVVNTDEQSEVVQGTSSES